MGVGKIHGKVIIIIPSQGHSVGSFKHSAMELKSNAYPAAIIIQTFVSGSEDAGFSVSFKTLSGAPFSWDEVYDVLRVITISHAGFDGPNLSYGAGGAQPWSVVLKGGEAAKRFWGLVGDSMVTDGKIILLGCHMGESAYAEVVSQFSGETVYASKDFFAAGQSAVVMKHVHAIEAGKALKPMHEF